MNICNHCKIEKPLIEFGKSASQVNGVNPKCKICCREFQKIRKAEKKLYDKEYRARHSDKLKARDRNRDPEKRRLFKLKKRFNLTPEDEQRMIQEQNNLCAICFKPEWVTSHKGQVKRLAVDHDKKTGKVRSLLCNNCNRALGMLYEDPVTIQRMLDYILKHRGSV